MKKILALLFALVMIISTVSLVSCGGENNNDKSNSDKSTVDAKNPDTNDDDNNENNNEKPQLIGAEAKFDAAVRALDFDNFTMEIKSVVKIYNGSGFQNASQESVEKFTDKRYLKIGTECVEDEVYSVDEAIEGGKNFSAYREMYRALVMAIVEDYSKISYESGDSYKLNSKVDVTLAMSNIANSTINSAEIIIGKDGKFKQFRISYMIPSQGNSNIRYEHDSVWVFKDFGTTVITDTEMKSANANNAFADTSKT